MLCVLSGKVPTWDQMKSRKVEGRGWCILCMKIEETIQYLILDFPFLRKSWTEIAHLTHLPLNWIGDTIEDLWKNCLNSPQEESIHALPLLIIWGTWEAQKKENFQDKFSSP